MMRGTVRGLLLAVFLSGLLPRPSEAISIDLVPALVTTSLGGTIDIAVRIAGLGDHAPPSLSVFDLDLTFDPLVLAVDDVHFGDPILGDQLALETVAADAFFMTVPGTVTFTETSNDTPADLNDLQAPAFILATLTLAGLSPGVSPLSLSLAVGGLLDADGNPLSADLGSGLALVVSAPATLILVGAALVFLVRPP